MDKKESLNTHVIMSSGLWKKSRREYKHWKLDSFKNTRETWEHEKYTRNYEARKRWTFYDRLNVPWCKIILTNYLPPSSSESDMKVSCISSGACTLYFSSIFVVVVVVIVVVTIFSVSMTVIYPSFWAMFSGVWPF